MIAKHFQHVLTNPDNNISQNVQNKLNEALRFTILNKGKNNVENSGNKHVFTNENFENGGIADNISELPITVDDISKTLDAFEMLNKESDINTNQIKRLVTKKIKNFKNYLTCQVPETLAELEKIQVNEGAKIGLTSDKFLLDTYMIKESFNNDSTIIPIKVATDLQTILKQYQGEFPQCEAIDNLSKSYSKFLLENFENIDLVHAMANFHSIPLDELSKITLPRTLNLTMSYVDNSITRDTLLNGLDELNSNVSNSIKNIVNNYLASSWESLKTSANFESFKTFIYEIPETDDTQIADIGSKIFYHKGYFFLMDEDDEIIDFIKEKDDSYMAETYKFLKIVSCALCHNYDKDTNTFYFDVDGRNFSVGENGVTFSDELVPEYDVANRINYLLQVVTKQEDVKKLEMILRLSIMFKNLTNTKIVSLKPTLDSQDQTSEVLVQKLDDDCYNLIAFKYSCCCGKEDCDGNGCMNENYVENYEDTFGDIYVADDIKFYNCIKGDAVLDLVYSNLGYVPYGIVAGTSTQKYQEITSDIEEINDKLIELAGVKRRIEDYIEKIEYINSELNPDVPDFDELEAEITSIKEELEHDLSNTEDEIKKCNLEKEDLEMSANDIASYATSGEPAVEIEDELGLPTVNNMDILPTNVLDLRKKHMLPEECPLEINDKVKIFTLPDDDNLSIYGYVYNISSFGNGTILVSTSNGVKTFTFDDYRDGKLMKI